MPWPLRSGCAVAVLLGCRCAAFWMGGARVRSTGVERAWGYAMGQRPRLAPVAARQISEDDFARNYQYVDRSGVPEKQAEIEEVLPGVDMDKLCKEVPEVLIWPRKELEARLAVLQKALPGMFNLPPIMIPPYVRHMREALCAHTWHPRHKLTCHIT